VYTENLESKKENIDKPSIQGSGSPSSNPIAFLRRILSLFPPY